ncbi:hypothetical protein GGD63_008108 [Bradyrhizobium sp. cir1]|uniref:hypothetical protein n=1 Tax=Bradyrhizobium sp. cir1 TaxID=1445730 RepID=UPI00160606C2|nr:hypothetical protein [Bradyrhizobium sp. cir1]MBB4375259.1 hypothetical protein [Bradyrhizobium sp. cir1]
MTFRELILKKTIRFSPGCQNFAVTPSGLGINALNRTELNTTARAVNSDDHSRSGARALPELPLRAKCSPLLSPGGLLVE